MLDTPIASPRIASATVADQEQVIAALTQAFSADPPCRWTWPDPHQYRTSFPDFVRAFAGRAFEQGTASYVDDFAGAALWLPPGVEPDEAALIALFEQSVAAERLARAFELLEQMGSYHPHEPHWYLPLIGVQPSRQGSGFGSALLGHTLANCDRDGLPAYLEASSQASVPLYQRHGFELLGIVQVGDSPPLYPMLRRPR